MFVQTNNLGGLKSKIGIELLWTNPNQTSKFPSQTVEIDTSKHSMFIVLTGYYSDSNNHTSNIVLNIKNITQLMTSPMNTLTRRDAEVTDDGINFTTGYYISGNSLNAGSWTADEGRIVPKYIYGVY